MLISQLVKYSDTSTPTPVVRACTWTFYSCTMSTFVPSGRRLPAGRQLQLPGPGGRWRSALTRHLQLPVLLPGQPPGGPVPGGPGLLPVLPVPVPVPVPVPDPHSRPHPDPASVPVQVPVPVPVSVPVPVPELPDPPQAAPGLAAHQEKVSHGILKS